MKTRGFTLVELMVSIALFGLIASGAMMLVMTGLRMQAHSARVDIAQSASRTGLDFMTRDLLDASSAISSGSIMIAGVASPTIVPGNNVGTIGITGQDTIELYMGDTSKAYSYLYQGSAVIASSASISVDATAQFSASTIPNAILTDLTNANLLTITGLSAPSGSPAIGTLTVSGLSTGLPSAISSTGYTVSAGAYVFALRHVKYSIARCYDASGTNAAFADTIYARQTCLMMDLFDGVAGASNPQPLAEGVEDLQIAYGFDTNGDGNITWIFDNAGDVMPATLTNLKVIRISISAISTLNENGTSTTGAIYTRPALEDHAAGTADGFFRRIIQSKISVRNFNI